MASNAQVVLADGLLPLLQGRADGPVVLRGLRAFGQPGQAARKPSVAAAACRRIQACSAPGNLAITLISNWKPDSQVTPTAVAVG